MPGKSDTDRLTRGNESWDHLARPEVNPGFAEKLSRLGLAGAWEIREGDAVAEALEIVGDVVVIDGWSSRKKDLVLAQGVRVHDGRDGVRYELRVSRIGQGGLVGIGGCFCRRG